MEKGERRLSPGRAELDPSKARVSTAARQTGLRPIIIFKSEHYHHYQHHNHHHQHHHHDDEPAQVPLILILILILTPYPHYDPAQVALIEPLKDLAAHEPDTTFLSPE